MSSVALCISGGTMNGILISVSRVTCSCVFGNFRNDIMGSVWRSQQFACTQRRTGAQRLSGSVLDSRQRAAGSSLTGVTALCPWARHIYPSLVVLVQHRKTCPYITEKLLMGRKESNQKPTQDECSAATAHGKGLILSYPYWADSKECHQPGANAQADRDHHWPPT